MNSRDFTIWLKGFLAEKNSLKTEELNTLKGELKNVEDNDIPTNPYAPFFPIEPMEPSPTLADECPKCGIKLTGIMGYVCTRVDCPTGLSGPTFSATPPTTN